MKFNLGDRVHYHPVLGEEHDGKIYYVRTAQFNDTQRGPVYWLTKKAGYVLEAALSLAKPSWCTGRYLHVEMPDRSVWSVPVWIIVLDRASFDMKRREHGDIVRIIEEDVIPQFRESIFDLKDWASNNMNWEDVEDYACQVQSYEEPVDYQEGWVNGEKSLIEIF